MIAAITAICLLCAGVSTTDIQDLRSVPLTAIELKETPWNPAGLPANYFIYSLQRSGDRIYLGTLDQVFRVAATSSVVWQEEAVRFYHSASFDVFGMQVIFRYDKKPLVLLGGEVWCELACSFKGEWGRDVTSYSDVLVYTSGSDSLVAMQVTDILSKRCDASSVVSRNTATHVATPGEESLFVALRNRTVRWGEAEKNLTVDGVQTWTASEQVGGDVLLAGFNSTSKTNYFVLLDSDMTVVDVASYKLGDTKGSLDSLQAPSSARSLCRAPQTSGSSSPHTATPSSPSSK